MRRLNKNNTSGFTGVYYLKRLHLWTSQITLDGRALHLGCFRDKESARQAREEALTLKAANP